MFICLRPSPLQGFCFRWLKNFTGSEPRRPSSASSPLIIKHFNLSYRKTMFSFFAINFRSLLSHKAAHIRPLLYSYLLFKMKKSFIMQEYMYGMSSMFESFSYNLFHCTSYSFMFQRTWYTARGFKQYRDSRKGGRGTQGNWQIYQPQLFEIPPHDSKQKIRKKYIKKSTQKIKKRPTQNASCTSVACFKFLMV